jgi:hypothetical protein
VQRAYYVYGPPATLFIDREGILLFREPPVARRVR